MPFSLNILKSAYLDLTPKLRYFNISSSPIKIDFLLAIEPDTESEWKIKTKSLLGDFLKERGEDININIWEDIESRFYKMNKLTISVSYIKCVKLDEIEIPIPWSSTKKEDIKNWATPDRICNSFPELRRKYELNRANQQKIEIVDGIHRINRAKELGMKCIRARLTDEVIIDKTDTNNIELRK